MILCKKSELKLLLYYTYQFRANNSELQIHLGSKDDELLEMKRLVEESQKEIEEVIYKYSLTTNDKLNQNNSKKLWFHIFEKFFYALTAFASKWILLAAHMLTKFRAQKYFSSVVIFNFSSDRNRMGLDAFPRLALRCTEARSFQGF